MSLAVPSFAVSSFVVRVWLSDRPGALGQIATVLGEAGVDLVGIDILERGAGRAIDEFLIETTSPERITSVERAIAALDGVDVEDIRPLGAVRRDPRLDSLETAVALVECQSIASLLLVLSNRGSHDFEADWSVVFDHRSPVPLASTGAPPDNSWLAAFVSGSKSSIAHSAAVFDVLWANLPAADLTLVMGRTTRPFRAREKRQATALVRIADARWQQLMERSGH